MFHVARICKLSAQVSRSVSRRWGHVYVLHARFTPQLCWREGGRLSRQLCCEIRPSHILLLGVLFFFFPSLVFLLRCWCLINPQKTAKRPVYPACFQSQRQALSHRYQGGTGEVWLFSARVSAKMCVSALFPSASRLMLWLNILPRVKKNQREFAF